LAEDAVSRNFRLKRAEAMAYGRAHPQHCAVDDGVGVGNAKPRGCCRHRAHRVRYVEVPIWYGAGHAATSYKDRRLKAIRKY